MPIYEYRCPTCGDFDVMQKITEQPLKKCPHCKKAKVTKLMSNTAFQLKGTGWYVTDYASKNKDAGGSEKKDSSSDASSSSNGAPSTDTTSATDKKSEKKASGTKNKAAPSSTEAA